MYSVAESRTPRLKSFHSAILLKNCPTSAEFWLSCGSRWCFYVPPSSPDDLALDCDSLIRCCCALLPPSRLSEDYFKLQATVCRWLIHWKYPGQVVINVSMEERAWKGRGCVERSRELLRYLGPLYSTIKFKRFCSFLHILIKLFSNILITITQTSFQNKSYLTQQSPKDSRHSRVYDQTFSPPP